MPTANPYTNGFPQNFAQNGISRNNNRQGGNDRYSGVNPQLQAVYERQAATAQARAQAQSQAQQRSAPTRPQQPPPQQQRQPAQQAPFRQTQMSQHFSQPQPAQQFRPPQTPQPAQTPPKQGETQSQPQFSPELIARLQEQARVEDERYEASKNGANPQAASVSSAPPAPGGASSPLMPPIPPPAAEPPKTNAISEKIGQFAQNEHNGSVFYGYLAEKALLAKHKTALKSMSENCRESCNRHIELHKNITQMVPNIAENPIQGDVSFKTGLKWAIEEEATALSTLTDLRENVEGAPLKNNVAALMFRKMSDITTLQSILLSEL